MLGPWLRRDYKAVDKREPIGAVYGWLRGEDDRVPVVCDRGRPYGLVHQRRAMRHRLDRRTSVEHLTIPGVAVGEDATVWEALEVCARSRVPFLPVLRDGRLAGYVRALDLLRSVASDLTADRLATELEVLDPSTSVGEAMHRFLQAQAHVFAVAEEGRLFGVVSRAGLLPLATDPREGGRKGAAGEVTGPRTEPVSGYVDGRFEVLAPRTPYGETLEVVDEFGFALLRDLRGVVTPESAARAVVQEMGMPALRAMPEPGPRSEGLPG